ncbi:PREDICTED: ubiquinone biosynthesis O-methyltransferase, mitochondrial [Tarenaya hassleriana]|uniref:ubiquinone biosynthesis O-methyltransferase, mitochondrial n=1 Tax=Tarenaya hassleriana TaxID=28532 RepID=UPI00053C2C0E|nr:PREDICTED: ubiquinone biosynthesis O-methyltransferase, mitochondrial [Tarenaya hassleriana]XP_010522065.1 PREDICTED: ubiquinone biosynthesis O-methyltransferase, mitochondrial [Tarenaya hassleriana]
MNASLFLTPFADFWVCAYCFLPQSLVLTIMAVRLLNQLRKPLPVRRFSPQITPPPCFLLRRPLPTTVTVASSAAFSSSSSSSSPLPDERTSKQSPNAQTISSLKQPELAKFSAIADTWWDSEGPFKPLHLMNPTRLAFIRSTLCRHFRRDPTSARPFEGLSFIDVGCGGGILSEPLARLGATVTGVDAVDKNIKIARLHAGLDPATSTIEYHCTTAEKLVEEERKFDAVLALEVIEHVANPAEFCKSLSALTSPDGATIVSTINRSMRAYMSAIVAAEYILNWLPKGTHQWTSFLTPEELAMILQRASIDVKEMAGFVYNPLTGRWLLSDDVSVNFIAYGTKRNEPGTGTA